MDGKYSLGVIMETFNRKGWPDPRKWVCYDKSNGNSLYGHTDPSARHVYSADAVNMDGVDAMLITAKRTKAEEWESGFVTSKPGMFLPLYGTIKVSATLPVASGIWPAIWCCAKNGGANRAEMDLAEVFYAGGDTLSQHLHFPLTTGKAVFGKGHKLPVGPHTYWAKVEKSGTNAVRFTLGVDNTTSGSYVHPNRAALEKGTDLQKFWDVRLNVAVSDGKYTGVQDNTKSPQIMRVDWVTWNA
jgi:hypothetical protein